MKKSRNIEKPPANLLKAFLYLWLGWMDSNHRMTDSEPGALPLGYTPIMVEGAGFEPAKALPTDLQSAPFGHSGTPPNIIKLVILILVGMEGFEPPASCSQGKRASQTALHPELSNARNILLYK